ncbi:hypothetical protein SAMN05192553_102854 [Cyclobacterium xiamenense]|uniref:Uncharacterized protein n=1 Tax=Cyclobacterium xiamenense TaxID=1297121 RepID=A0A1H6WYL6_9BACT|nr:hypothetical protein SAMN05192553_102854 [Cyclobacterium xiamenense]
MVKSPKCNFRKEVVKALYEGIISKVEAKECLKRGFGNEELPLFFDFPENGPNPLRDYILGLEKMGIISPLFR